MASEEEDERPRKQTECHVQNPQGRKNTVKKLKLNVSEPQRMKKKRTTNGAKTASGLPKVSPFLP